MPYAISPCFVQCRCTSNCITDTLHPVLKYVSNTLHLASPNTVLHDISKYISFYIYIAAPLSSHLEMCSSGLSTQLKKQTTEGILLAPPPPPPKPSKNFNTCVCHCVVGALDASRYVLPIFHCAGFKGAMHLYSVANIQLVLACQVLHGNIVDVCLQHKNCEKFLF